jgi:hypothetical protein
MKEELASLLEKYYRGETTLQEEDFLKKELKSSGEESPESDLFGYYDVESEIPEGLEEAVFSGIGDKTRKRNLRLTAYLLATAAVFLFVILLRTGYQGEQQTQKNLLVMEQALSALSQSLQPATQEPDMLVLWVDNNVEVIIN